MSTISYLLRDTDSATRYCLYTTDEFMKLSYAYGVTFNDPLKILFNFIYRFGDIYDSIAATYYLYNGQTSEVIITYDDTINIGTAIGETFMYTFAILNDY
jgi:hypothetical protein